MEKVLISSELHARMKHEQFAACGWQLAAGGWAV
jgi:hypothetical protein